MNNKPPASRFRVGSVSFLNAKPLIYGLEREPGIELRLSVPSALLDGLRSAELDVALLPVIDLQRMGGLSIVPAGGISSDGPTLTVRLFSATPIEQTHTLECDSDSHTSVALARIILGERMKLRPEFVTLQRAAAAGPARPGVTRLLIGDKVINAEPPDMPYQLDLGEGWKELTGLPFTFAVWTARPGVDLSTLPARLDRARREGLDHLEQIVAEHAGPHRWPAGVALTYFTKHLTFGIGPRELEAIRLFHQLASQYGVIDSVRQVSIARAAPVPPADV